MTLPSQYVPLPFSAAQGVPQTVPFQQYRVTLLASSTDLPALLQTSPTEHVVEMAQRGTNRPIDVPAEERELFRSPAPYTLDAIRPMLIVRDNDTMLGSLPALAHTRLRFGLTETVGVEIYIDTLTLAAASFTQPGEVGAQILIGITTDFHRAAERAGKEEDLYDLT